MQAIPHYQVGLEKVWKAIKSWYIREQSGKYFDPEITDKFLNLVEEGKI
jgi:response regulator RpfG family c-di-GMP phosphodiesterase